MGPIEVLGSGRGRLKFGVWHAEEDIRKNKKEGLTTWLIESMDVFESASNRV